MQPISQRSAASSFHTLLDVKLERSAPEPPHPPTPVVLKHWKSFLFCLFFLFYFISTFSSGPASAAFVVLAAAFSSPLVIFGFPLHG